MDCILCHPTNENVLWKNKQMRVIHVDDPIYPGYFRVIWNTHVAEMSDLSDQDREMLQKVLLTVEKVIRQQMKPDKINLAQFGNMVPHLHWHIIARYRDDAHFPESIWGQQQRKVSPKRLTAWQQDAKQTEEVLAKTLSELF